MAITSSSHVSLVMSSPDRMNFPVILHSPMVQNKCTHMCICNPVQVCHRAAPKRVVDAFVNPAFNVTPLERANSASIGPACAVALPKGAVYASASPTPPPASNASTSRHDLREVLPLRRFHSSADSEPAPCICMIHQAHTHNRLSNAAAGHLAHGAGPRPRCRSLPL